MLRKNNRPDGAAFTPPPQSPALKDGDRRGGICSGRMEAAGFSSRSFTLLELLIGAIVFGLVAIVTVYSYTMINRMWKEDLALNELSHNANIALEKMSRGAAANTGLMAASSVESPALGASSDSVNYTDMNNVARRFYYSGGNIRTESESLIVSNVTSVTFSNIDHMIRINLILHKHVVDKEIVFSVQTRVSPRN